MRSLTRKQISVLKTIAKLKDKEIPASTRKVWEERRYKDPVMAGTMIYSESSIKEKLESLTSKGYLAKEQKKLWRLNGKRLIWVYELTEKGKIEVIKSKFESEE